MAIFGEYVQALVSHLRMWKPRKWEDLRDQVDTDTRSLHEVFGKHAVSCQRLRGVRVLGADCPVPLSSSRLPPASAPSPAWASNQRGLAWQH